MSTQVLFICTGNFYRSRFAEAFFNHHAGQRRLNWKAFSRGLATHLVDGCGPISLHTVEALSNLKIDLSHTSRQPQQLSHEDLVAASRIIALKEAEHRPMLKQQFPAWADKVDYWQVHDLDFAEPVQALAEIRSLVLSLVDDLSDISQCAGQK